MNERHNSQLCRLSPEDEPAYSPAAVVAVEDRRQDAMWGCEPHAASALNALEGARIAQVADWSAARRLLALPWNIASTGWPVKRRPRGTFGGRRRPGTSGTPGAARPTAWVPRRRPLPAARCGLLVGHPTNTATAYRRDLRAWSTWCAELGVHPLATERHVDAWVRHLTTNPQPRTGRPASAATVARKLSALAGFYDYGLHDAGVLTHSPAASVRRPKVADESQAIGLVADELKRLLAAVAAHSSRSAALVWVFMFCGLRISEALGADVRDYSHDQGHRVFEVTRKGGKAGRVALAPPGRPSSRRLPRGADQRTAVPRP